MEKVIAVLTQKGSLSKGIQDNTTVNLFKLQDEKVTEFESIHLSNSENNHFSLLMVMKKVSLIYIDTISNDLKRLLEVVGIRTKCKDDTTDDMFINKFIFD